MGGRAAHRARPPSPDSKLIGLLVSDILQATSQAIQNSGATSPEDIQRLPANVVQASPLYENMYRHYRVYRMQVKAERILEDLFQAYTSTPQILPRSIQEKAKRSDLLSVVGDYIAGMTDRFALTEHSRLFDPQVSL